MDVAADILSHLQQAHQDQIEDLGLKGFLNTEDSAGEDKDASKDDFADGARKVADLISALASQDKYPLLVCTDDYNALFGQTSYVDESERPLSPHELRLVCAFRWLERPDIVRGTIVASSSTSLPVRKTIKIPKPASTQDITFSPFSYEEACLAWGKHGLLEQPSQRSKEEQ